MPERRFDKRHGRFQQTLPVSRAVRRAVQSGTAPMWHAAEPNLSRMWGGYWDGERRASSFGPAAIQKSFLPIMRGGERRPRWTMEGALGGIRPGATIQDMELEMQRLSSKVHAARRRLSELSPQQIRAAAGVIARSAGPVGLSGPGMGSWWGWIEETASGITGAVKDKVETAAGYVQDGILGQPWGETADSKERLEDLQAQASERLKREPDPVVRERLETIVVRTDEDIDNLMEPTTVFVEEAIREIKERTPGYFKQLAKYAKYGVVALVALVALKLR